MENNVIVLSGPSASGKSTIASYISQRFDMPVFSIRKHYEQTIMPMWNPLQPFTRETSMKAADWMYAQDPAFHAKLLESEGVLEKNIIIESLRIKGDVEYIAQQYPETYFIHCYADHKTRLLRKLMQKDSIHNYFTLGEELQFEWDHFCLEETMDYLIKQGALVINTSKKKTFTARDKEKLDEELAFFLSANA